MDDIPVFPVVILAGLTVFGLAFVASQDFDFATPTDREEVVFVSQSFGEVGSATQDFRNVNFGDFSVGETRGDIQAYQSRKDDISNSLFSGERIIVGYNATQPKSGEVTFEVLGRDGPGAVYVSANGQKVFQENLIATGTPEINIPARHLKPGMNEIVIGTTRGGLISSTTYGLEDIEVTVNDRKFHDYRSSFQMYDYEVEDFVAGELTFDIRSSIKTQPLEVYINDREVYSKKQVRISPEEVSINPTNADLHPGYNSIRFETDGNAEYHIENAEVTLRYLGNSENGTRTVGFESTESERNFAGRGDTDERISFEYQRLLPSSRRMILELNEQRYSINPDNGLNVVEFESEALEEDNLLTVSSNTTYQLNNLEVLSEKVED